jgi:UDP-N-acetylmuramate dehydrogenase
MIYLPGSDCPIKSQISLAKLTSFRVGGPAQWYVAPQNLAALQASFEWAKTLGLAVTLLGAGSNLLVSDRGLLGLVIGTRRLRHTHFNQDTGEVRAGAGNLCRVWHGRLRRLGGKDWSGHLVFLALWVVLLS